MNGRTFIDSNVLIYGHDVDAGGKHEIAKNIRRDLWADRTGVPSTQVLQELYVNVTQQYARRRREMRLARSSTAILFGAEQRSTVEDILTASKTEEDTKLSFWDALIITLAAKTGAMRLLSDDLNPEQSIAGVMIVDPFAGPPPIKENKYS